MHVILISGTQKRITPARMISELEAIAAIPGTYRFVNSDGVIICADFIYEPQQQVKNE